jgi:tetratricopeptide (TPR) repeat protein
VIALVFALLFAGDLDRANRAYEAGRWAEAAALYRAALDGPGSSHATLWHNLGNCAFRLDRSPEAILYYRRALHYAPDNTQAQWNLHLAERRLGVTRAPPSLPRRLLAGIDAYPRLALALAALLQAAGLVAVLRTSGRARRLQLAAVIAVGLALGSRVAMTQCFAQPTAGVILEPSIAVRPDPHATLPVIARLDAGQLVRVEEASDRWARITHAAGSGWVERAVVGLVE